ncbi:uncharacterized protein LOC126775970 isoform X1 [Nymphalis io]|uniref:uncharacterized protein LOC126775970 isoform X1 n=2 Tax=Inachis io TaxID=171585 RepID=UPI002166F295|nr:uncharacterized protein LOC126775970 isoform X1 [Nymphalis io]
MKYQVFSDILLVFAFAVTISGDKALPNNNLEEQVLTLFNKWQKGKVHTGLFQLPSLKSISIEKIQENYYEEMGIKILYAIGKMKLTGLDNFSVEALDIAQTKNNLIISATVLIPKLTLYSDTYTLVGRAYYVYSLKGNGAMTIVSRNNVVSINIVFNNVDDIYTSVSNFSLKYSTSIVEVNLENSSWPINEVLNSEGVNILKSYHENISDIVRDYVVPNANEYLSRVTFKDFLNIITYIGTKSYVIEKMEK